MVKPVLEKSDRAVGAATGQLVVRRLPGNAFEWIVFGALFGVTVVGLGYGSALLASGLNIKHWVASLVGGLLVAWSVGDLLGKVPLSPFTVVGHIAVWPLEPDWVAIAGVLLAVVLVVLGMRWVSGISLEAAERRTALVGQMRFAVTLQDLRTVLVLRRQLSQEHPRSKPWIRAARRTPKYPVWHRGVRSGALLFWINRWFRRRGLTSRPPANAGDSHHHPCPHPGDAEWQ